MRTTFYILIIEKKKKSCILVTHQCEFQLPNNNNNNFPSTLDVPFPKDLKFVESRLIDLSF